MGANRKTRNGIGITRCPTAYAAECSGQTSLQDRIEIARHNDLIETNLQISLASGLFFYGSPQAVNENVEDILKCEIF